MTRPSPGTATVGDHILSVVVPCFNEEATVVRSVERLLEQPFIFEVIVVDDHSTDRSYELVSELTDARLRVIRHDRNHGKGAVLRTGFTLASGPFVGVHDADLEYDPRDLRLLLQPLVAGDADVVYGSRFVTTEARRVLYFWHSVGNRLLTLCSNMLTNLNLSDIETCYKVFRRDVLEQITIEEDRFGVEPELTAKVAALGVRIYEVGISYHGRSYAAGKKIGWRDGVSAFGAIVRHSTSARLEARRDRRHSGQFDVGDDASDDIGWIINQVAPRGRGRVLEIGAGHGTFSRSFAQHDEELVTVESLEEAVGRGPFETIILTNVLEHLDGDEKALVQVREALAPTGTLYVLVPAFDTLDGHVDREIGHYRRYTRARLEDRIRGAGLDPVDAYYLNGAEMSSWMVVARHTGRTPIGKRRVGAYDRRPVPMLRWRRAPESPQTTGHDSGDTGGGDTAS